jgi:hypothetical protein
MTPFTVKEVTRYLVWIAVLLAAVAAIFWMLWQAPGHKNVPTQRTTAAFLIADPSPAVLEIQARLSA